jgi:hypothetical protein
MHEPAHTATSIDALRLIQPKMTAMLNIGVKTATDALIQVAIRRVTGSDGPKGTSPIAGSRIALRISRSGKKPLASYESILPLPVSAPEHLQHYTSGTVTINA